MITYEAQAGERIERVAEKIVGMAKIAQNPVSTTFNGIRLIAAMTSTVKDVLDMWERRFEENRKAYRESPEGKAAAQGEVLRAEGKQHRLDQLMLELDTLDFTNQAHVIKWVEDFQDPSDYIGLKKDPKKIVKIFAEHGYFASVNLGSQFHAEDKDNVARYIVGQALDGLNFIGAIHGMIHSFIEDWRKKSGEELCGPTK